MMALSICESEENRKKLAWLVPAYVLLAWFVCVLFQPLGFTAHSAANGGALFRSVRDRNYQVFYLDHGAANDLCKNNSIVLSPGNKSAVILRLGSRLIRGAPFECTVRVVAGEGLDGVTMMVEEMDLKEYDSDSSSQSKDGDVHPNIQCQDYVEVSSSNTDDRNKFCGHWGGHLGVHRGPYPKMVDSKTRGSNSTFHISISIAYGMGKRYGLSFRERKSFTMVFTGFRNAAVKSEDVQSVANDTAGDDDGEFYQEEMANFLESEDASSTSKMMYEERFRCQDHEFMCAPAHFSETWEPQCVWGKLKCDTHFNCGYSYNIDEAGCPETAVGVAGSFRESWSMSTVSLLIVTYLAIVSILILVTMLLLRWHRALRTPLEILHDSRYAAASRGSVAGVVSPDLYQTSSSQSGTFDSSEMVSANGGHNPMAPGSVSIMVMYARSSTTTTDHAYKATVSGDGGELPPSYESLFMGDSPPNYNVVNMPPEAEVALASAQDHREPRLLRTLGSGSHCQCDCDHTSCNNARD